MLKRSCHKLNEKGFFLKIYNYKYSGKTVKNQNNSMAKNMTSMAPCAYKLQIIL